MATFRVGQRVRLVDGPGANRRHWIGCEVTVLGLPSGDTLYPTEYEITRPETEAVLNARCFAPAHHLAPLTDPKADAFIESLKRLGREPQPEAPHVHRERVTNG